MASSSNPPPAAAASAASQRGDSDETLARKWAALEQLTQVYGFDAAAAKQAIEIVGCDVQAACDFILDEGLGTDKGGPIVPINNCPHLEHHFKVSVLSGVDEGSFNPSLTTCSHDGDAGSTTAAASGKAKSDVDDSGKCPSKENWFCLECGALRCSRYVNGHGLQHWEATKKADEKENVGHCVALSLSDLSVWCYVCGAYVHHPSLAPILKKMEELKFNNAENGDFEEDMNIKPAAK